ncbi:MAG: hypothetical protein IH852_13305 [Bacteroidetes bacterium]|nr:hypothetical protein [Bacteroidota bacterium]
MSYFIIDKLPVFLTSDKYNELREEATKDKDASWRVSSMIQGHKETEEKDELMYELLLKKYQEDKSGFLSKWYSFDIKDSGASINIWDLLYDYSVFYGYSYLEDFRDYPDKLISDYEGESLLYPMGKVFCFTHFVKPKKCWWKFRYKMNGRRIEFIIDVEKVKRINGNLTEFFVHFADTIIKLNKNIQIYF